MIRVDKEGPRWTVTLNRPGKANALTLSMLKELSQTFADARRDAGLRVLVVTGAGERAFCAGADLAQAAGDDGLTISPIWEQVSNRLARLPVLTIAALNGTVAGGGFGVTLACDLRVAVPGAGFFYPVLANGFLPQPSDVRRMSELIGPARARMILMAGQKLKSDEALACGLIDRIAPRGQMAQTLTDLSAAALTANRAVLVAIKRMNSARLSPTQLQDCYRAVYDDDAEALQRLVQVDAR